MKSQGFTLLELLVALAIFAMLAALGWKVFDMVLQSKQRNAQHEQQLSQLQQAYLQIQRDLTQAVAAPASVAGQGQSALIIDSERLQFSKGGVSDPLLQDKPPLERVEYQYDAQQSKLYRLKYSHLSRVATAQPLSSVLLSDVQDLKMTALNPEEQSTWPTGMANLYSHGVQLALPRGLKFNFRYAETEYTWIFSLVEQPNKEP
ncbi:type II secretion system protein GspJ [Acinetobacter larvae]|uniref:Type II secretion system protein J n=1 Tax=Acinetobacter larvae TaxID=1789224 RepID=A0A1B2LYE5_9GAMM|nr:type II secretion system protein GspJ [Acinetobacter larvae]